VFNWERFLEQHGVEYVTRGPSVTPGNVAVRCPFCGDADTSHHLAISLKGRGWRCWRSVEHAGRSPVRLVQALLRCSWERAQELVGGSVVIPETEALRGMIDGLMGRDVEVSERRSLALLKEFRPLPSESPFARPFYEYLSDRGYDRDDVRWCGENFHLHYATSGLFRYRIILPIYDFDGALVTWSGRSILPDAEIRYKVLSTLAPAQFVTDLPLAVLPPSETLYGFPELARASGGALVLCEGPLDALWLSLIGRPRGVWATCLFGLNVTDTQVSLIEDIAPQFGSVWLLLDDDAELHALRIMQRLAAVGCRQARLPLGVGDPAELPRDSHLLDQFLA
jgi:hypothetical protein